MKRSEAISIFGVMGGLLILAAMVVLYAQGYRLDLKKGITETGLILVKSLPDGARVYLNGELVAATDSSIPDLKEGTYTIKIEKDGHQSWEKTVPVKPRLVTSIEVLLPPISPSLGFLRTRPQELAEEPKEGAFTSISSVTFSPTEDQVLVRTRAGSWLFPVGTANPQEVAEPAKLLTTWEALRKVQRTEVIQNLKIPDELQEIAVAKTTSWSPDERKFLYKNKL